MNADEVRTLLSGASALDHWLKGADPEERAYMLTGWSTILRDVPLDFAQSVVRGHYSQPEPRTITPGDIMAAWTAERRRTVAAEREVELRSIGAAVAAQDAIPVAGALPWLRDMMAAVARGEDPESIERPAGVRVLSPQAVEASRRCRFPDICVCTHTECRDGWLDEETTKVNALGKTYPAVQACPVCHDALVMAEERGLVRRHRGGARRR